MNAKSSYLVAIVAAVLALGIVIARGPLWLALAVAVVGGVGATMAPRLMRHRDNSAVGIR